MSDPVVPSPAVKSRAGKGLDFDEAAFAHEIAHGLASLVVNSKSALEILGQDLEKTGADDWQDLRTHLRAIYSEAQCQVFQALTVIHHLMPQYAAGLLRPDLRVVSPMSILAEMLPSYVEQAGSRGIGVDLDEPTDPESFPKIEIECNTMRRVFHNVLSNAIKYSYSGVCERQRYVKIWGQRHDATGQHWAIKLQNYGIGLQPQELPHAFQPGFRGQLAQQENTFGTGLGLADVQACMHAHDGWARIESKVMHGETYLTTLSLVFPRYTNIRKAYE